MYSITSSVSNALASPAREVSGGVCVYDDTGSSISSTFLPTGDLVNFNVERTAPMGKFFGFLVSHKLTVVLMGSHPIAKGTKLEPYYTVDNTTLKLQYFYVGDEVTIDETTNTTTIVAYDIFQKAKDITIDEVNIEYPISIGEYAAAVVAALGSSIEGEIGNYSPTTYKNIYINKIGINPTLNVTNINGTETLFEILTAIAEATGTICYVHSGDKIAFRTLVHYPVRTVDASQYFEFSTQDTVKLTQVASTTQLGENISYGEEGFTQAIWDNPFLELYEDIEPWVENIGRNMIGTEAIPYSLKWRGNPWYEVGDCIAILTSKTEEAKHIFYINGSFTYDGGFVETLSWESEESEDIYSTPTSLSAVLKQTYTKVDKVNNEINLVAAESERNAEAISALQINTQNINASVQQMRQSTESAIAGVNSDIETLIQRVDATMTPEAVEIQIQNAIAKGTTEITTTTGFTFNEEGLSVAKSGSEMTTQITEDGMTVYKDDNPMLVANNEGVEAINLNASTYLIIGLNSRFEDYDNRTRTGCFWIGG